MVKNYNNLKKQIKIIIFKNDLENRNVLHLGSALFMVIKWHHQFYSSPHFKISW